MHSTGLFDNGAVLAGQVAIVTGSSAGIGYATAVGLRRAGASVVLNGRDAQRLAAAARTLRDVPSPARDLHTAASGAGRAGDAGIVAVCGDASDPATVASLVGAARDLGGPHIAIANAGGGTEGVSIDSLSAELLVDAYRRNAVGAALLIQAAAREMRGSGYGRIVTVASVAARRGSVISGPEYSAAKAALIGLTKHTARELGPHGITVNCVAPGATLVPRIAERLDSRPDGFVQGLESQIPLGRLGTAEEVAAAICFLASPAASYVTGVTLDVNGGLYFG